MCVSWVLPFLAAETVRLDQFVGEAEEELLCDSKLVDDVGDGRGDCHGREGAAYLGFVPLHIARREDDLWEKLFLRNLVDSSVMRAPNHLGIVRVAVSLYDGA